MSNNKQDQVHAYLLKELKSGKYPAGSRFLSETEVTKNSGFCKNTVREAFSALVGDGLIERIRGKGSFVLDPSVKAASVATPQTVHVFAFDPLGQNEEDAFIGSILIGLHHVLDNEKIHIKLHPVDAVSKIQPELERLLAELPPADSLLLGGFNYTREMTDLIRQQQIRTVALGKPEDDVNIPYVHGDNLDLYYQSTRTLLQNGHKSIAFVDNRQHEISYEEHRAGYLKALSEAGVIPDARLMIEHKEFDYIGGKKVWDKLAAGQVPFTAVVVYGNHVTYGLLQAANAAGIKVPDQLSVYTICDTPVVTPELVVNRIFCNITTLAKAAGKILIDLYRDNPTKNMIVEPKIYPGNSIKQEKGL